MMASELAVNTQRMQFFSYSFVNEPDHNFKYSIETNTKEEEASSPKRHPIISQIPLIA
jgi:hypothetical protein